MLHKKTEFFLHIFTCLEFCLEVDHTLDLTPRKMCFMVTAKITFFADSGEDRKEMSGLGECLPKGENDYEMSQHPCQTHHPAAL